VRIELKVESNGEARSVIAMHTDQKAEVLVNLQQFVAPHNFTAFKCCTNTNTTTTTTTMPVAVAKY